MSLASTSPDSIHPQLIPCKNLVNRTARERRYGAGATTTGATRTTRTTAESRSDSSRSDDDQGNDTEQVYLYWNFQACERKKCDHAIDLQSPTFCNRAITLFFTFLINITHIWAEKPFPWPCWRTAAVGTRPSHLPSSSCWSSVSIEDRP